MSMYHLSCVAPMALFFLAGAVAYWRSGLM